jgi:DNA topoisomerase III
MRLFIAEKPSVARSLAALVGAKGRGDGFFHCPDVVVTWCVGHLFETAFPEFYDPAFKTWRLEDLPIAPKQWVVLPKDRTKKQLKTIGMLLRDAHDVVNAGDPDNEGQLLVDEVLEHFKSRKPVLRFWATAQDDKTLRAALQAMRDNREFVGFRDAARARQRADWLIGMNFSRAYTLRHQAGGGQGVISVGRVQTPTLAMVAARDEEIANFRSIPFHVLVASVHHDKGAFAMRWKPAKDQPGLDEEGRLVDASIADAIASRVSGATGKVTEYSTQHKSEAHPKGLSLTGLTLLASNAFGYGASDVLDICQALYETHKLTSYPRTDCEFMPTAQHAAAPEILSAISINMPAVAEWARAADPAITSKMWDDSKLTAHHAIVPTAQRCSVSLLNEPELNVYQLIVRAYIAQFLPLHEYFQTTVLADAAGETFVATGRRVTVDGWKELYAAAPREAEEGDDQDQALPSMLEGDPLRFERIARRDRKTKPPPRFTEGTLIVAMENVYKFIDDPRDKKALQDGDGIGTPATRAAIIFDLKRRHFLVAEKKFIVSTPAGREALQALPDAIKSPSLTALYQRQLKDVERGALAVDRFVGEQLRFVSDQVAIVRGALPETRVYDCPSCGAGELRRIQRKDRSGHFWSCSRWRDGCQFTDNDVQGRPALQARPPEPAGTAS